MSTPWQDGQPLPCINVKTVNIHVWMSMVFMLWKFTTQFFLVIIWFVDSILFSDCRSQQRAPLTSHLLEETDKHRVETFGHPLPVQISERLTSKEGRSWVFCFWLN